MRFGSPLRQRQAAHHDRREQEDSRYGSPLAGEKQHKRKQKVILLFDSQAPSVKHWFELGCGFEVPCCRIEKENLFRFYVGSVARTISRRAKCSVLLLTQPTNHPKRFKKIIVNGVDNPKTVHTVKTVLYISKHEKLSEFTIIQEDDLPVLSMTIAESSTAPEATKIKKEMMQEENIKLQKIVDALDKENINVVVKTVHGKPGYAISQYAKQKDADLLVFNSPDTHLGIFDRIFTHDIEYALANLPCNLLIVHSRV